MANAWHRTGVWVIDTGSASVIDARHLKILDIRWVGATLAGHVATLTDRTGARIWKSVAGDENNLEEVYRNQWVDGLICPEIGSGFIEVTTA